MGIETAIIGSALLGAGASAVSAKQQSTANNRATAAQQQSNDQALQFQRDAFNRQTELAEPFREFGIQQANGLGELFGFNPVGQVGAPNSQQPAQQPMSLPSQTDPRLAQTNALSQYVNNNPDLQREFSRVQGGGFGPNLPRQYDRDSNGALSIDEYGQFHFDRFGRAEGREMPTPPQGNAPFTASPTGAMQARGMGSPGGNNGQPVAMGGEDAADPNAINTDAQDRGRERFQGSLFNDALQGALGRAATGVDANFAASGNVYSGAREQAQQNTAADLGMNALGMYTNAMLGQPSTAGAQMGANAAGAFGANSANLAMQGGQNAANSAYAQGQNAGNLTNNLASLAQFGLGAFTGGRGGGGGTPGYNGFAGGSLGSNSPSFFG